MAALRNWAGNVTFAAREVHRPADEESLRRLVAASSRLRVLGSGHSFSPVADTDGDLVVLDQMPADVDLDTATGVVRVAAGLRYGDVVERLHAAGRALPSMGSLPHICVAGAAATGTHGSGDGNQVLGASVVGLRLVTADGDVLDVGADDPRLPGAVVSLGTLGVVTHLDLATVPTYDLTQTVLEGLPLDALDDHLDDVMAAGYSVSVFTTWGPERRAAVWCKRLVDAEPLPEGWLGTTPADGARHPVPGEAADHATQQLGEPGPWFARLPHFRLEFTPSVGEELQSEWLVPRGQAVAALRAVAGLADLVHPVLAVSELRSIAADGLWLSPAEGRDSLGVHFTWVPDTERVLPVVEALEEALAPFAARPHWGKVFRAEPAAVQALYPRLDDFRELRRSLDPTATFGNAFTARYVD
ncbi:FAD-binding protein [Aquipuribacter nitratireducens]|uniref:FAD-binding protein n=1 Tax=Aquipuribacter nitratireducens TaxID=650104 RepID=A0ABW0GR87_9MICO